MAGGLQLARDPMAGNDDGLRRLAMKYITIDIGGTAIKHGIATAQGRFVQQGETASPARQGAEKLVAAVCDIVRDYEARLGKELGGVAIDTAGIVEPGAQGRVIFAGESSFPGYTGMALAQCIREQCQLGDLPLYIENDVNAAALGEYWLGAARGAASVFMLTVGTGLGGALLRHGRVWHGAGGSAGEIGQIPLPDGTGTLETRASVSGLLQSVAAARHVDAGTLSGRQIFAEAAAGDAVAAAAIAEMLDYLAQALALVCCIVNPELIVLGGGIMAREAYIRPRLTQRLAERVAPAMRAGTRLAFAGLGNQAGQLGALYALLHDRH